MAIKEIKREWSPCQLGYVKEFLLHTEEDLKNMPRCSVGSKAIVSETDNEYVKTNDGWMLLCDCDEDGGQGAGGGGGGVQPDWNQSDETAADYVKNRTHYTDYPYGGLVIDKNVEGLQKTSYIDMNFNFIGPFDFVVYSGETATPSPNANYPYPNGLPVVILEEMGYSCGDASTGYQIDSDKHSVFMQIAEEDVGKELSIRVSGNGTFPCTFPAAGLWVLQYYGTPCTTQIGYEEIHPLDPKYLPSDITIPSGGSLTLAAGATVNDEAGVLGGSGGADDRLNVTITQYVGSSSTSYAIDKTHAEIMAAIEAMGGVHAINARYYIGLNGTVIQESTVLSVAVEVDGAGDIVFVVMDGTDSIQHKRIVCNADGSSLDVTILD